MRKVLSPKEWIEKEKSRAAYANRYGAAHSFQYPWQPWEDHVIQFYEPGEALEILFTRNIQQIVHRRKKLGLKTEKQAPVYETCPTCKTDWRLAA